MEKSSLLAPLRERDFARLWVGQSISDSGDWVNYVALTSLVWDLTGSAWMVAVLRACHTVPVLLLGPFAGVFVDRWNRKTTMVVVNVLRAALILMLTLTRDVTSILLLTFAFNVAATFFTPAKNAIIPHIVSRERLLSANSLSSTTKNMAQVIGPAVGGVILALGGTNAAFYFNGSTFLFAAVAIASMTASGSMAAGSKENASALEELKDGFRFASSRPPVRSALILEVGQALGWGCVNVVSIVIAEQVIGGGPTEYGLLLTSMGLGALTAALLIGGRGDRFGIGNLMTGGFVLMGLATLGLANSRVLVAASVSYFIIAMGRTSIDVTATTIYQRAVPAGMLGRIFALRYMATHTMLLFSNQVAGAFTDAASLVPLFVCAAALEILCAFLSRYVASALSQRALNS